MKSDRQERMEESVQRADALLRHNRFIQFAQMITPLMVIIGVGFAMFAAAVIGVLGLTIFSMYQSLTQGNLLLFAGGLVLFGLEGLGLALGSYNVFGHE